MTCRPTSQSEVAVFLSKTVDAQEPPKAEGKRQILDLRFGNVRINAQSVRIRYQDNPFVADIVFG